MFTKAKNVFRSTKELLATSADESLRSRRFEPRAAIVFLTYRCTSRCVGCNMWQRPTEEQRELAWEDWLPVLERLAAAGIDKVELFGGDALLRKDTLVRMIDFCREHGIRTFFPTNSIGLTEKTVNALVDAGLNVVYLSLDELPDIDGTVRGIKRHFDKVMRAIDWFRTARGERTSPRIECITTVSASNWRRLPELLVCARDHGADAHHVWTMSEFTDAAIAASKVGGVAPDPYFVSTDGGSHRLSTADGEALRDMLVQIRANSHDYAPLDIKMQTIEHLDAGALSSGIFPHQTCLSCTNVVVVSPYGEVTPCPYYANYVLGNLKDRALGEIWANDMHREFVRTQRSQGLPLCDQCSLKFVYRPFMATVRNEARRLLERLA